MAKKNKQKKASEIGVGTSLLPRRPIHDVNANADDDDVLSGFAHAKCKWPVMCMRRRGGRREDDAVTSLVAQPPNWLDQPPNWLDLPPHSHLKPKPKKKRQVFRFAGLCLFLQPRADYDADADREDQEEWGDRDPAVFSM